MLGHAIATRYRAKTRAQFVAVLKQPTGRFIKEVAGAGSAKPLLPGVVRPSSQDAVRRQMDRIQLASVVFRQ